MERDLRVGFYGTGRFANSTHLPNLLQVEGVTIAALCDVNEDARRATAEHFGLDVRTTYADAHEMLAATDLDILYSCVPGFARTDVEIAAAQNRIHIFSEKPQAVEIARASAIDRAIQEAGVLSTVGFRERYRPSFQEIKAFLADKEVIRVSCEFSRAVRNQQANNWIHDEDRSGGWPLDWGVHAVDYTRFMTGLEIKTAQAFYFRPAGYSASLSCAFNFQFCNGGTMSLNFTTYPTSEEVKNGTRHVPLMTIFYVGGRIDIYREGTDRWSYERNGERIVDGEVFDPWLAQDRAFIRAVRQSDRSLLLNDYHDGLRSLAPILAGWQSARQDGAVVALEPFLRNAEAGEVAAH